MKQFFKTRLIMLLPLLMLHACIKEDLSECVYHLQFNFEPKNLPASKSPFFRGVKTLSIFAFDEEGLFVKEFVVQDPEQSTLLELRLPDGLYSFMAWAGYNAEQHGNLALETGVSTINDFNIRAYTVNGTENAVPAQTLFYGMVNDIAITVPPSVLREEIVMSASTKPLNLQIMGLDVSNYQLIITDNAGRYDAYNNLLLPHNNDKNSKAAMNLVKTDEGKKGVKGTYKDGVTGTYSVSTALLWPSGHGDRKISIVDRNTGYTVLSLTLSELLGKLPGYNFDHEAAITILINYRSEISIDVNINGWWIIHSNDEV
ncbi:MAG TPA: FimB/Mfa2 family fimbrial subunit [Daejeonella sp.]